MYRTGDTVSETGNYIFVMYTSFVRATGLPTPGQYQVYLKAGEKFPPVQVNETEQPAYWRKHIVTARTE